MNWGKKTLRLLSIRSIEKLGEDGETKVFHFARFADEATFDSHDFMLPKDIDPNSLTVQTRYIVDLDLDGKFTRISLTPAAPTTAAKGSAAGFPAK